MKIEQLNPFIRYASLHQAYHPQKENSICYDCRVFYVLQGDGTFFANGESYKVSHGFCAYLPPQTQYRFVFSNPTDVKIYVLNFDLSNEFSYLSKSLSTATESTFNKDKVLNYTLPIEFSQPIVQQNALSVSEYVANCTEVVLHKTEFYKHFASAFLKLALINLLRYKGDKKGDYKLIKSVQEYIRSNYQNAELTNSDIANRFNYHPYHINRLMKAHTDKTLHDYLIDYRLHIAKYRVM